MACSSKESPQLDLPVSAQSEPANGRRWLPMSDAINTTTRSRSTRLPQIARVLLNVAYLISTGRLRSSFIGYSMALRHGRKSQERSLERLRMQRARQRFQSIDQSRARAR